MAFMLGALRVQLTWREIFRRMVHDAFFKDNCLGLAAQLAYYFFFSLSPALLFLIAVASFFPVVTLIDEIVSLLGTVAPPEVIGIVTEQIKKISGGEQGGLLTLGMLVTLWTSSSAMTAVIDTVNRAYGVEEGRSWWRVRLLAIALTMGAALFILVSSALVLVGPELAGRVADWWGLGPAFERTWTIVQWPLVFILVTAGIALTYQFAPDVEQRWAWLLPGAIFATLVWLATSLAFRYYVENMSAFTETYGAIGGVMVLLLWFYLTGLAILLGAEMNAEIEHAAPAGKDVGEKVPGERRRLGAAAMRAWIARRRRRGEKPPTAEEVRKAADSQPSTP
jgi:membrane protein